MVEYTLPVEKLKAWQRCSNNSSNVEEELGNLLDFLCIEVENEQHMKLPQVNTIFMMMY